MPATDVHLTPFETVADLLRCWVEHVYEATTFSELLFHHWASIALYQCFLLWCKKNHLWQLGSTGQSWITFGINNSSLPAAWSHGASDSPSLANLLRFCIFFLDFYVSCKGLVSSVSMLDRICSVHGAGQILIIIPTSPNFLPSSLALCLFGGLFPSKLD